MPTSRVSSLVVTNLFLGQLRTRNTTRNTIQVPCVCRNRMRRRLHVLNPRTHVTVIFGIAGLVVVRIIRDACASTPPMEMVSDDPSCRGVRLELTIWLLPQSLASQLQ